MSAQELPRSTADSGSAKRRTIVDHGGPWRECGGEAEKERRGAVGRQGGVGVRAQERRREERDETEVAESFVSLFPLFSPPPLSTALALSFSISITAEFT